MGKPKKANSASARGRKLAQSPAPPSLSPPQSTADSSSKIIKSACEQAIRDVNSNPQKSLKKIKDLLSKHPNSAALHHTQSFLHFKRYSQTSDSSSALKLKYLNNAIDSAKQALSLFPNSITLNYLYCETLIKLAQDSNDYQNIINQCWKGIKANPSAALGPGEDIVASQLANAGKIQESRIQGVKELLLDIVEQASVESLMSGENMTKKMKERTSLRILQLKRLRVCKDELFRRNQNLEREKIESKIEHVRDWRQRLRTGVVLDSGGKKVMAKIIAELSKKIKVLERWREMGSEERRGLLEVSFDEIADYYIESDHFAAEIFLDATELATMKNKWKCLLCCLCEDKFLEWEELRSHVFLKHLGGLSQQLLELVPNGSEDRYVEEIENGVWKPVDVDNMVEELSRFKDCKNDVYQEKCKFYSDQKKWMFCDDVDRQELLKKIHRLLMLFLKNQCLPPCIVSWMWDYTIQELEESLVLGFKDLVPILEQMPTPLCICFLWLEQLEVVFDFLEKLSNDCGLEGLSSDDGRGSKEEFCDYELIHFSRDQSCLILDKIFIRGELRDIVGDEGTAVIPEKDMQHDTDSFVHWLYMGDEIQELLSSWRDLRNFNTEQAIAVFQFVETEIRKLKNLRERKCRLLEYQEAFPAVKNICLEEQERREEISEYKEQTFASLMLERQNELVDAQSDIIGNEHACILNVLRFAQDVGCKMFGLEETWISTYTQFPDLECHEDKEKQDIMVDVCVEKAIKMEKQNMARELCEPDVLIMKSVASIKRMEPKFMLVSVLDYQLILVHLVKLFLRAHLEDLADEEVVEKATAAETLLAMTDLAPEPGKNMTKGSDNSRTLRKKSKDNSSTIRKKSKHKKRKDQVKAMDEETGGSDEHFHLDKENAQTICYHNIASDGGSSDSGISASMSTEDLKQQEEEHGSKIRLENLNEMLEDRRHKDQREETSGNEEFPLHHENGEKLYDPLASDSGSLYSAMNVSISTNTLKQEEEELQSKNGFENLADEEVVKKANGAGTLLVVTDLAPEPSKNMTKGSDNSRTIRKKSKDNSRTIRKKSKHKKRKDQGKAMDEETGGRVEHLHLDKENAQTNCCHNIASDGGSSDSGISASMSTEDLKQQEEEHRSKIRLENLNEMLEDWRHKDQGEETSGNEEFPLYHENGEKLYDPFASDSDYLDSAMNVSISTNNLKQEEEELQSKNGFENLDESLENQRQFENRTKQNYLVETNKKTDGLANDVALVSKVSHVDESGIFGTGLKNDIGENNCFLNVIIQCLWNIQTVRSELSSISDSGHEHVGDPCIVCGLADVFGKLSEASTSTRREIVSTTSLRIAISKWSPHRDLFQEGQMNDAEELLQNILGILHQSFTSSPAPDASSYESDQIIRVDFFQCTSDKCLAHRLFGIDICGYCDSCGQAWRHQTFSDFSHYIDSSQLRKTKNQNQASSFDKLLKLMLMNDCSTCKQGCGKPNDIQFILRTAPTHVFICVLNMQTTPESREDIRNTLAALDTEIDIGVVYVGPRKKYCLVSMVCYVRQHYVSFHYSDEGERWTMYDDAHVEVIGCWNNLFEKCVNQLLKPRILFFECRTFPFSDLYFGDIKADFDLAGYPCPQFDDLRKFSGRSSMLCNPGVGEVKQGPSAEGIPEDSTLHNDQTAKDGGGDLQSDGQHEMKILHQDKIQDACRVQKHVPLEIQQKLPQNLFLKEEKPGKSPTDLKVDYTDGSELGAALKNYTCKNYSSLNVIIQSLWHIPRFRNELTRKSASEHKHFGDPCIFCGLAEIFVKLNAAHINTRREIVSPTSLSIAIDKLSPCGDLFQKGKMNNAFEVLQIILDSLHQSLAGIQDFSLPESDKRNRVGSLECTTDTCLAHTLFGTTFFKIVDCDSCGLESRQQQYTSFFHTISAFELRKQVSTLISQGTSSLDELLKFMLTNYHLSWEPDGDGCCENHIKYILQTPPHVFTSVLEWTTIWAPREDIRETLAALATEIDIGILYQGLERAKKYCLVSLVCYRGLLYLCFIYSHEYKRWTMYVNGQEEVIGSWDGLCNKCVEKHFQPRILFFVESAPTEMRQKLPQKSFLKEEDG